MAVSPPGRSDGPLGSKPNQLGRFRRKADGPARQSGHVSWAESGPSRLTTGQFAFGVHTANSSARN
jgi:hypothetical protein